LNCLQMVYTERHAVACLFVFLCIVTFSGSVAGKTPDTPCADSAGSINDTVTRRCVSVNELFGTWKVYDFKCGIVSAMSQDEADRMMNQSLEISEDSVTIADIHCSNPAYSLVNKNLHDYLYYGYRTGPKVLGLSGKEKLCVVNISCGDFPDKSKKQIEVLLEILHVDDDTIIVPLQGIFFYLRKQG